MFHLLFSPFALIIKSIYTTYYLTTYCLTTNYLLLTTK